MDSLDAHLWIRGANEQLAVLSAENRELRQKLKALVDHLQVEFKDCPATPAYVTVVSTKPERYTGGPSD